MTTRSTAATVLVAAAAVLLAACSSTPSASSTAAASTAAPASASSAGAAAASPSTGSASPTSASPSTSVSASARPSVTPTPTPTPTKKPTRDRAIEGTWHADAASVLTADADRTSMRSFTSCTGPVVLTFTAQGRVVGQGRVTCAGRGPTGHGQFASAGRYTADGAELVVTRAVTSCSLSAAGRAVPCSFAYGDGVAHYRVEGTHLTITFRTATGTRTQTYQR